MKTYKYYVHGKPKTFDLTALTNDEIEKFKNMDNTERLKFIELHHLENKPLWDTVDIKTSTKLTDEGLNNEKNYKKYYDLYKNQNIKNKLEQMKKDGKTGEVNEKDLKDAFSDEDYKDIDDKVKKGYKDIDSLINYYVNKIETLNVDSIDSLKAKEIQNLEAKNISKISVGLDGLKSVAETYKAIQEELNKHKTPEDKTTITEAILKDKDFIKELTDKTGKALNVNVSKDDLIQILNDTGLINEIIKEVKDKIKTFENVNKNMNDTIIKAVKDFDKKIITEETLKSILKEQLKEDDEKITQIVNDFGTLKELVVDVKKDVENVNSFLNSVEKVERKVKEIDLKPLLDKYVQPLVEKYIDEFNEKSNVGQSKLKDKEYDELTKIKNELTKMKDENIYKLYDYLFNKLRIPENKNYKYIELNDNLNVLRELFNNIKIEHDITRKNFADVMGVGKGENDEKDKELNECGKFLNRFKDYQPEIDKIKSDINMLKEDIKGLNENMIKLNNNNTKSTEIKTQVDKPSFLNDISKPKNLKSTVIKTYEPEEEHKDLKDILRRRREDIEPDEIEEDDEDWGEGIRGDKVIKFKELLKMLNN